MKAITFLLAIMVLIAGCSQSNSAPSLPQQDVEEKSMPADQSDEKAVQDAALEKKDEKSEVEVAQEELAQVIADGTYTEDVFYDNPAGGDTVTITIVTEQDIVTEVSVVGIDPHKVSKKYIDGVNTELQTLAVGKPIDELNLPDQISGSSLTVAAFKQHVSDLIENY